MQRTQLYSMIVKQIARQKKNQLTWLRDSSPVFVKVARALQFRLDAL